MVSRSLFKGLVSISVFLIKNGQDSANAAITMENNPAAAMLGSVCDTRAEKRCCWLECKKDTGHFFLSCCYFSLTSEVSLSSWSGIPNISTATPAAASAHTRPRHAEQHPACSSALLLFSFFCCICAQRGFISICYIFSPLVGGRRAALLTET